MRVRWSSQVNEGPTLISRNAFHKLICSTVLQVWKGCANKAARYMSCLMNRTSTCSDPTIHLHLAHLCPWSWMFSYVTSKKEDLSVDIGEKNRMGPTPWLGHQNKDPHGFCSQKQVLIAFAMDENQHAIAMIEYIVSQYSAICITKDHSHCYPFFHFPLHTG